MKKYLILAFMAFISWTSLPAQTKQGDMSAGIDLGYAFETNNVRLSFDYYYNITDELRLAPSINYFLEKDNTKGYGIDMDLHYLFPLSDLVSFYPLAGLSWTSWNSGDVKRFGANLGLALELYATDQVSVGVEAKYNIVKDIDQAILGLRIGYAF